jgi:uncharacterized protein YhfF
MSRPALRLEGEGDLSLAGWRSMHHAFWTRNSSADGSWMMTSRLSAKNLILFW